MDIDETMVKDVQNQIKFLMEQSKEKENLEYYTESARNTALYLRVLYDELKAVNFTNEEAWAICLETVKALRRAK